MWAKPKIYWKDSLFGLSATSTATGFDVDNLLNRKEGDFWKATSTADQYITFDAGVGNTYQADYLVISGHNLNTIGATLTLQYSTDNFSGDINDAFTGYTPTSDLTLRKEFTSQDKRYWRIKISGTPSAAAQMAIAYYGEKVELDYVDVSFDPNRQNRKAEVSVTQGGYVSGIHTAYTERQMSLKWQPIEIAIHDKIVALWETNGLKNFVIVWDETDHAADIFLMRMEASFNNPFVRGGLYRNVSLNLKGRKE